MYMNQPPVMVSTKDSMYICDILNVTHAFMKKFKHYDNEIQDAKLKQMVQGFTTQLENQYQNIMGVLKNGQ